MLTRTRLSRLLRLIASAIVVLAIAGYALSRSLPYIHGPEILVLQPLDGSTIATTTVDIVGRAIRINSLRLDGKLISVDEAGNFKERLVVFPGVNVISLDATDQFKRQTRTEVRVYGAI